MGLHKLFIFGISVLFLTGCSIIWGKQKQVYWQGYKQGVAQGSRHMVIEHQKKNLSDYYWKAPLVQEVRIPAHVANGVMIPEHKELVIIKPGQWVMDSPDFKQIQQEVADDDSIPDDDVGVFNNADLSESMGRSTGPYEGEREGKDDSAGDEL